jgi:hypothetical protein
LPFIQKLLTPLGLLYYLLSASLVFLFCVSRNFQCEFRARDDREFCGGHSYTYSDRGRYNRSYANGRDACPSDQTFHNGRYIKREDGNSLSVALEISHLCASYRLSYRNGTGLRHHGLK